MTPTAEASVVLSETREVRDAPEEGSSGTENTPLVQEAPPPVAKPTRRTRKKAVVELSLEEATARISPGVVEVLRERLRGDFREVRRYEPREVSRKNEPAMAAGDLEIDPPLDSDPDFD